MYTAMATVLKFKRLEKNFDKWLYSNKMTIQADYPIKDLRLFSQENKPTIVRAIGSELNEIGPVKVNLTFYIHLTKETIKGTERIVHYFRHDNPFPVISLNQAEISKEIDEVINSVFKYVDDWVKRGSGWVIER